MLFFWYFFKCTIRKVLFFNDKGAYLQLEKQKTPVYNVCWSVQTPPLRNPHFSSHSTQPHHPPHLTFHRHFLVLQALAPQGYFLAKLSIPCSLHSSYISSLTYHPLSQTKILATKQKKRHTSHFRAHTALFRYFKYKHLKPL